MNFIKDKSGFALLLSIFLILAFAVLGLTVLSIIPGLDTDIWIKQLASSQALYLAESARNFSQEFHLPWGTQFTNTTHFPNTTTKTLSNGTFTIAYSNRQAKTVTASFQGNVGTCKRKLQINYDGWVNVPAPFKNYAVFSYPTAGLANYKYDTVITGNIYSGAKTDFYGNAGSPIKIYGNLYVKNDVEIKSSGNYIYGNLHLTGNLINPSGITITGTVDNIVPLEQLPPFTTTYYNQEIQRASSIGSSSATWLNKNLGGQNWYINGTVNLSGTISGGPANIVATGVITLADYTIVQEGISLIGNGSGSPDGISVGYGSNIGGGSAGKGGVIYLGSDSYIGLRRFGIKMKGCLLGGPSSSIVPTVESIGTPQNTEFWGLAYGNQIWQGGMMLIIRGAEVGQFITFNYPMTHLTYDSTYLPLSVKGLYNVQRSAWGELSQ